MNKSKLLQDLYIHSFNGDIDKVTQLTSILCEMGVSYRLQNKVLCLAYSAYRVEHIIDTIEGLILSDSLCTIQSLN